MIRLAFIGLIAIALCSCASYKKEQDQGSINGPVNCDGYHVRTATWHFMDNQGLQYDVIGRCVRGMKHGTFDFLINGQLAARTKFVRDAEVKTYCFVKRAKVGNLDHCLTANNAAMKQSNYRPNQEKPQNVDIWVQQN